MTYLFKLARRMATGQVVVLLALGGLACTEAAPREFLSADPNTPPPAGPVSLVVVPGVTALPYDQITVLHAWGRKSGGDSIGVAVNWSATAGQIQSDGTYRGTVPGTHTITAYAVSNPTLSASTTITVSEPGPVFSTLTIFPDPVQVFGGSQVIFGATARLQSGANTLPAVTWTTDGGTISPGGAFVAGLEPGTFAVVATTIDGLLTDTVMVVVQPAALTQLVLEPKVVTVAGGGSHDFQVSAHWSDGTDLVPDLEWETTAGTITTTPGGSGSSGLPGSASSVLARLVTTLQPGTYKVVVRHPASGRADTASVTVTPVLTAVEVSPASVDLLPGATAAFTAVGRMSDGSTSGIPVLWSATGGTVTGAGVFTAGPVPGTFRVIGRLANGSGADTAVVQISQPAATLTGITISPSTGTVPTGGLVEFAAAATWSNGSTALPGLSWTAQGGSITSQGRWTAPATPGTYRVVARHAAGTLADTALYTVVVAPPSLTALSVSPKTPGIQGGQVIEFQAQATWSNGSNTLPPLTWTATGGSVNGTTGRWTAPNVSGVYRVVARATASGLADTAVVTVTETPRVTGIAISPRLGALNPGGTLPFSASVTWSDGQPRAVSQTWTATKGTVSMTGLFTAGNLAGQAMVILSCSGCTVADTALVTITEPVVAAPTVTQLDLTPATASLPAGGSVTFQVEATWSDGAKTVPPLVWTAPGGTMTGMKYTAGSTAGTYHVIARVAGATRADTTAVTITAPPSPPAPTVTKLNITPLNATLDVGTTRQFAATATMSNGTTTNPQIQWSATGGTISATGLYTAGNTAGTFRVIATCSGCGRTDTTAVTLVAPPPPPPPPSGTVALPEAPRVFLNTAYQAPGGTIRRVAAGGNLQSTINAAQCGDRVLLAAGATFTGNFTLPNKGCTSSWIEISTETALPPEGTRVVPAAAASYAKIITAAVNQPALSTAPGASSYRIMGVQFGVAAGITSMGAIVSLDPDGLTNLSQLPRDIVLDRVVILGHGNLHVRRCLLMNAIRAALIDSYLAECHYKGADAQAVLLWNTPGPIKVVNNYLEGSGENMMIGGADPSLNGMVPSDIEIRRNHFFTPMSWYTSGKWTVKNSFELKLGKRVLIEGNVFENNWADAQTGFAVLFKSVNQGGGAPWSETSDVMFVNNIIKNTPHGINLAARPEPYPAVPMARVAIMNNLIYRVGDMSPFGGGRGMQFDSGVRDVTVEQNTMVGSSAFSLLIYGAKSVGTLSMRNNVMEGHIASADGLGVGTAALTGHLNQSIVTGNGLSGPAFFSGQHPAGNVFASSRAAMGFVSLSGEDFRLAPSSPFVGKGIGGVTPGVAMSTLQNAVQGVAP